MKNKKKGLRCFLGFHDWNFFFVYGQHRRVCNRCPKKECLVGGEWVDAIGREIYHSEYYDDEE